LRILFALTIVLGVSTPTFEPTTANSVDHPVKAPVFDLPAYAPGSQPVRLSLRDIEGFVGQLTEPAASVWQPTALQLAKRDVPAARDQISDDELSITVPIARVCEALADAASAHDLPIGFFARLIWQESRFDQWARSGAGAMGVAQFMPLTAIEYGLHDPFDPIASVAASARFLRQLRDQFGNLGLAAAAYNAGGGKVRKWLNGQSSLPEETQNYVQTITGHPARRWTMAQPLQVPVALPNKAPCDGVDGLSRHASAVQLKVRLTGLALELLERAAAQRAKAARARGKRDGVARTAKGSRNGPVRLASALAR
jgi:hypothetical protein